MFVATYTRLSDHTHITCNRHDIKDIKEKGTLVSQYQKDIEEKGALVSQYQKDIEEKCALMSHYQKDIEEKCALVSQYQKDIEEKGALRVSDKLNMPTTRTSVISIALVKCSSSVLRELCAVNEATNTTTTFGWAAFEILSLLLLREQQRQQFGASFP